MSFNAEQKQALKEIFRSSDFKYYHQNKFIFKSGRKTGAINNFLKEIGSPESFEQVTCLMPLAISAIKKILNVEDMMEVVKEYSEENKSEYSLPTLELEDDEDSDNQIDYVKSLVPAINISNFDTNKIILLDRAKANRPALDIDPEFYLTIMGTSYKDLVQNEDVMKVMTCFDPYTLKSVFNKMSKSGSVKIPHVNYYVPPRWRFVKAAPEFEGFIKLLIDHLFPNKNEREYVLDWMHYAIVRRNETVLCLIGARGTGKGILLYNILSALIGEEYHQVAKQEVLTDKFNAEFKNKRFVFFDEVNVSGDRELNKFKALANSKIAMEAKGVDSETIDNYVSMALSSNDTKDFKAEPQDRRFSVPQVTDRPLIEIVSEDEIEAFCERLRDPDCVELAAFGNWLLARVPTNAAQKPLKGKYFFELCRLSMSEWKTFIIDHVRSEGELGIPITNKMIAKFFERQHGEKAMYPTRRATIESFLGDYIHEAVCKVGKLVEVRDEGRGRDSIGIMPNEEFLRKFGKKYQNNDAIDEL